MPRRHELALRLAVGADHRALLQLVLREGASLVMAGVLMGAPGIYFAGRVIRGLLGVTPLDPLTLTSVAVGLGLVTMLACNLPLGACWGSTRHGCFGRSRSLPRSAFLPSLSPFS